MKNSILFLTNAYPDFVSSYRGHFIKEMAARLQKKGYRISVVTSRIYKKTPYFEQQDGMKIYRFPFFARDKLLIEYERIPYLRMVLYYFSGFLMTAYVLFKERCNLIHAHWVIPTGLLGMIAGALFKRPFIVTIHGSDLRMAMSKPFLLKIFLYICKKAQHITCVSESQKRDLEKRGIQEEKISVFSMCVDDDFLEAGKSRRGSLRNRPLTVLSNRNLLRIYNVSLLIRAIPLVLKEEANTKFLIAGDGPERDPLEKAVKKLNVNSAVQFLGRIPHKRMADLLALTDIYLSTSLYDGTSVSLLEAMACGAFPVVTDIASNREWILDGENGFLVPAKNEAILAKKIVDAIRNDTFLSEASERNRKIIEEKAQWEKNINKMAHIYERSEQCF